eukprot:s2704_g2.t1
MEPVADGRPGCGWACKSGARTSTMVLEYPMRFGDVSEMSRMNLVCQLVVADPTHDRHLMMTCHDSVFFHFCGLLQCDGTKFTLVNVQLDRQFPMPLVRADGESKVFDHLVPSWSSMHEVIDLCSGFGGLTQGSCAAGFVPVVGVDMNEKMTQLYDRQGAAESIVGDVGSLDVLCKIWDIGRGAGTLSAGFNCQPFSVLGDQKGGADERAASLRSVLAVAYYLCVSAIVLECVPPAASNSYVISEIKRFQDATGFHCSQTELHLHDIWPTRRSRAWWLLTAPWIGNVPLSPWPKSLSVTKVRQVIPQVTRWHHDDEAKLSLLPVEQEAFGAHSEGYLKYLLNFEGVCPCALHSWGSQVLPCSCGCRAFGLSAHRLATRGLFGLLVKSAPDDQGHQHLRHAHPCEVNALNGFDPVIDQGPEVRLGLAAAGQIASPFQALWIFSALAERLDFIQKGTGSFSQAAQLKAYMSWILMRCRQVWTPEIETIGDESLTKLISFWDDFKSLSIHELLHPPRWPVFADHTVSIAQVLDHLIRDSVNRFVPNTVSSMTGPSEEGDLDDCYPVPPAPSQSHRISLPAASDQHCTVVFHHEYAQPVHVCVSSACTVHELIQAHAKLVGNMQVVEVTDAEGLHVPFTHLLQAGQVLCVTCENTTMSDIGPIVQAPVVPDVEMTWLDSGALPTCSPTAEWTQPAHALSVPEADPFVSKSDVGTCPIPSGIMPHTESWISAAPLQCLSADQLIQLKVPMVQNENHLWSLRHQFLQAEDRLALLAKQGNVWTDDEMRHHMANLATAYVTHQAKHSKLPVQPCVMLDPLLATGWLHHEADCDSWGAAHPEIP